MKGVMNLKNKVNLIVQVDVGLKLFRPVSGNWYIMPKLVTVWSIHLIFDFKIVLSKSLF